MTDSHAALIAEIAELRETNTRLNRRCQTLEAGIAEKVSSNAGPSLGRSLANAAATRAQAEITQLRAQVDAFLHQGTHGGCRVNERHYEKVIDDLRHQLAESRAESRGLARSVDQEGSTASEHDLKCWPEPYDAIERGDKRYEYRKDDRGFLVGDVLVLRRFVPHTNKFSGRWMRKRVTWISRGPDWGIPDGYCVMSIAPEFEK